MDQEFYGLKVLIILEQLITSVVEKKGIILMSKTLRFTGKSGSRIEDREIRDRGSVKTNLKIKQINKSWISGDVGRRLSINFTEHNPVRCTEH